VKTHTTSASSPKSRRQNISAPQSVLVLRVVQSTDEFTLGKQNGNFANPSCTSFLINIRPYQGIPDKKDAILHAAWGAQSTASPKTPWVRK
jgi:hypothetical protein